jgi:3-hydroxy acid dehydrogenase/malonic semialdehyde reductase
MSVEQKGCALLTGAAGGMGTAIATALVAAGHPVVLVDRDAARLDALAKSLGGKTTTLVLDITDGPKVAALPSMIPDAFKPIDILINNAGHDIGGRKRFDIGSADDWAAIVDTNLNGLMRVTRAILPDMVARDTGDIVNMGSIAALRIVADMAPYNASKAGIHMLTDIIRAELAHTGIRITEIMPGLTRTGIILTRYRGDRDQEKAYFDQFEMALDPEDIARSIMFALEQPRHVQVAQMVVLPVNRW